MFVQKNIAIYLRIGCVYCVTKKTFVVSPGSNVIFSSFFHGIDTIPDKTRTKKEYFCHHFKLSHNMKKLKLSQQQRILLFSSLLMLNFSCQERGHTIAPTTGKLIPVETSTKESNQYVMFCTMGHDGTNCKGCITMNGQTLHVDCQGAGNVCRKSSSIALSYDASNNLTACTLDTFGLTNLGYFNMPARSLSFEIDEGVYSYLNIPSQLVYRDTTTLQFTFTGLSLTNKPLY